MKAVQDVLDLWELGGAQVALIAARENAVFQIDHHGKRYVLRQHRKGYRTNAQLLSELQWMTHLAHHELSVPQPVTHRNGDLLVVVDGVQFDVLSWVEGTTLDQALPNMDAKARQATFHALGAQMATLHQLSDQWGDTASCDRPHWDIDGLVGPAPLWDQFWKNPSLTAAQKSVLIDFRDRAHSDLADLASSLDYGLIHADLVSQNVMVNGSYLALIDFDDGGYGFRLFDVTTALVGHRLTKDFCALKSNLIDGYHSVRPLDTSAFDLFMALRAVTYVGWNITRGAEDPTGARNARHIDAAVSLATNFLAT